MLSGTWTFNLQLIKFLLVISLYLCKLNKIFKKKTVIFMPGVFIKETKPVYWVWIALNKQQYFMDWLQFALFMLGNKLDLRYQSGGFPLERPLSSGTQTYSTKKEEWPLTEPLLKIEGKAQVCRPRELRFGFILCLNLYFKLHLNEHLRFLDPVCMFSWKDFVLLMRTALESNLGLISCK